LTLSKSYCFYHFTGIFSKTLFFRWNNNRKPETHSGPAENQRNPFNCKIPPPYPFRCRNPVHRPHVLRL